MFEVILIAAIIYITVFVISTTGGSETASRTKEKSHPNDS